MSFQFGAAFGLAVATAVNVAATEAGSPQGLLDGHHAALIVPAVGTAIPEARPQAADDRSLRGPFLATPGVLVLRGSRCRRMDGRHAAEGPATGASPDISGPSAATSSAVESTPSLAIADACRSRTLRGPRKSR